MKAMNRLSGDLPRRDLLTTTALAGAGILIGGVGQRPTSSATRGKRYALVGVGGRSNMYREAVLKTYAQHHAMVGFCDVNLGRLKLAQTKARAMAGVEVPIYEANDFDRMVRETKPDVVIVTTKDATHSQHIIRAMELGCDVTNEKKCAKCSFGS